MPKLTFAGLALLLGLSWIVSGVSTIVAAIGRRGQADWIWALIDGVVNVVLGVAIALQWPISGARFDRPLCGTALHVGRLVGSRRRAARRYADGGRRRRPASQRPAGPAAPSVRRQAPRRTGRRGDDPQPQRPRLVLAVPAHLLRHSRRPHGHRLEPGRPALSRRRGGGRRFAGDRPGLRPRRPDLGDLARLDAPLRTPGLEAGIWPAWTQGKATGSRARWARLVADTAHARRRAARPGPRLRDRRHGLGLADRFARGRPPAWP